VQGFRRAPSGVSLPSSVQPATAAVTSQRPVQFATRLDALETVVRARTSLKPTLGIVLGSGLGGLADQITEAAAIPFSDLPGWPAPTAGGHAGRLVLGRLDGVPIACLQGRLHLYEGLSARLVVEPVLLVRRLGAEAILLTNAAGGINPAYGPGTLMLIADHLNLTGHNPLRGPQEPEIGPRFPDLVDAWSPRLRALMRRAAQGQGVELEEGVYAGLPGPAYETPAEVRMLRTLGADAVGMSTVLEAIAARWAGAELCGISLISNAGAGITGEPLSHAEVLAAGEAAAPRFAALIRRFVVLAGAASQLDRG
jgi:purine-nucleoside phosphorylase